MSRNASTLSRRQFLASGAAAISVPFFVPARSLGLQDKVAPSERITVGVIGTGSRGVALINMFLNEKDVEILAVCDVDARHLQNGLQAVQKRTGKKCDAYKDFRQLLERKDIDAVVVATPDHWHGLISIAAARAGKDIYCEKTAGQFRGRRTGFVQGGLRKQTHFADRQPRTFDAECAVCL
jgi:hypothetical protein